MKGKRFDWKKPRTWTEMSRGEKDVMGLLLFGTDEEFLKFLDGEDEEEKKDAE